MYSCMKSIASKDNYLFLKCCSYLSKRETGTKQKGMQTKQVHTNQSIKHTHNHTTVVSLCRAPGWDIPSDQLPPGICSVDQLNQSFPTSMSLVSKHMLTSHYKMSCFTLNQSFLWLSREQYTINAVRIRQLHIDSIQIIFELHKHLRTTVLARGRLVLTSLLVAKSLPLFGLCFWPMQTYWIN